MAQTSLWVLCSQLPYPGLTAFNVHCRTWLTLFREHEPVLCTLVTAR